MEIATVIVGTYRNKNSSRNLACSMFKIKNGKTTQSNPPQLKLIMTKSIPIDSELLAGSIGVIIDTFRP